MNNLALNPEYASILEEHQAVLENWVLETGDKAQGQESAAQLKATYDLWKDVSPFKNAKINPDYDQFK